MMDSESSMEPPLKKGKTEAQTAADEAAAEAASPSTTTTDESSSMEPPAKRGKTTGEGDTAAAMADLRAAMGERKLELLLPAISTAEAVVVEPAVIEEAKGLVKMLFSEVVVGVAQVVDASVVELASTVLKTNKPVLSAMAVAREWLAGGGRKGVMFHGHSAQVQIKFGDLMGVYLREDGQAQTNGSPLFVDKQGHAVYLTSRSGWAVARDISDIADDEGVIFSTTAGIQDWKEGVSWLP